MKRDITNHHITQLTRKQTQHFLHTPRCAINFSVKPVLKRQDARRNIAPVQKSQKSPKIGFYKRNLVSLDIKKRDRWGCSQYTGVTSLNSHWIPVPTFTSKILAVQLIQLTQFGCTWEDLREWKFYRIYISDFKT